MVTSLTSNAAREAIYARIAANWTASPYQLENEEFTPPTTGRWARFVVRHTTREQATLGSSGNRRFQSDGRVMVQLFAPLDAGTQGLDSDSDAFLVLFEGVDFGGIRTHNAEVRETGPTGRWYQFTGEAFFDYEQLK